MPHKTMAQTEKPPARTVSTDRRTSIWKRLFGKDDSIVPPAPPPQQQQQEEQHRPGIARRLSRKVVPGLPRPGTFKRQQSELRDRLEPAKPNEDERRTLSVDRRRNASARDSSTAIAAYPRLSAPELFDNNETIDTVLDTSRLSTTATQEDDTRGYVDVARQPPSNDTPYTQSVSTEAFDEMILEELEKRWILNLSMHFRDKSKREKFFVTYADTPTHWRRVTISLDYRNAPKGSLEEELQRTRFQRDKSARIYEAIRESLADIQFYDTVTNLKLQTENERLHVHVVEDLSEIISFPPVRAISHLKCRRVREEELVFDSHLSGFVYKVRVNGQIFIKKEIPGPDTVDEFLYEINALHQLSGSHSVIQFGGVVLDNKGEYVKGLLISFAEQGALIDVIYDGEGRISWGRRERWARQIVQGLSEIHEAGFVQGDFTLSNIVIDAHDNAKIIDINRRGCPVGWEPPEVAALIESSQRISMYIGVKSDLYQLGMVLYALATQEDEPENHRPLNLSLFPPEIPDYFLDVCYHCLDDDPRHRSQAAALLTRFPDVEEYIYVDENPRPIVVEARNPDDLPYSNGIHLDRSRTFGMNGGFNNYPPSESSDGDYPRRGRSTRRSRSPSPPMREFIDPAEFPLPPSSIGSDYLDSSHNTPISNYWPLPNDNSRPDEIPTPTSIIGPREDFTQILQAVEFPAAEEEATPPPSIIKSKEDFAQILREVESPEEVTPTSITEAKEECPPVLQEREFPEVETAPISITGPKEEYPQIVQGVGFPEAEMTPTSMVGPEEDFAQIPEGVELPEAEMTPIPVVEPKDESTQNSPGVELPEREATPTPIVESKDEPASGVELLEREVTPASIVEPKDEAKDEPTQIPKGVELPEAEITLTPIVEPKQEPKDESTQIYPGVELPEPELTPIPIVETQEDLAQISQVEFPDSEIAPTFIVEATEEPKEEPTQISSGVEFAEPEVTFVSAVESKEDITLVPQVELLEPEVTPTPIVEPKEEFTQGVELPEPEVTPIPVVEPKEKPTQNSRVELPEPEVTPILVVEPKEEFPQTCQGVELPEPEVTPISIVEPKEEIIQTPQRVEVPQPEVSPISIVEPNEGITLISQGLEVPEPEVVPISIVEPKEDFNPVPQEIEVLEAEATPTLIVETKEDFTLVPRGVESQEPEITSISIAKPEEELAQPPQGVEITPTSIIGPKEDFTQTSQQAEFADEKVTPIADEPRKTVVAPLTPPPTVIADELAGIGGAHSTVPLGIPLVNLDDDLTTDMHNDRIIVTDG